MFTSLAAMEILIRGAIETGKTLHLIFHGMRVYKVHNNSYIILMSLINKLFKFVRSTEAGRSRKEIRHMVSERAIIRVLLNSHYLDAVVPRFHDARQHIDTELIISAYSLLFGGHTDMAFVNFQRGSSRAEFTYFKFIGIFRHPNLSGEDMSNRVLHHISCPSGDTLALTAIPYDDKFIEVAMLQHALADL